MRISPQDDLMNRLLAPASRPRIAPAIPSPKAKAEANRIAALKALRHWGHLRVSDIARLLWPHQRYGEQMAARLMRRLQSEAAQRINALGTRSFVLTRRGAAALDALDIEARHGLELCSVGGATFIHRTLGTAFGIAKQGQGFDVYGEHAIAGGIAPVSREALVKRFKKLPDLLLVRGDRVIWVEVEASAKPLRELQGCVRIASAAGHPLVPGSSLILAGLTFAFDASQGHAQRIARAARQQWSDKTVTERRVLAERVSLAHLELGPFVRWKGMREQPLAL